MKKIKMFSAHKILKIFKWAFLVLISLFIILIISRVFYLHGEAKTNAQVIKIHNTKLTMDDVVGKNLPPDPGVSGDATVQGIDANDNGIRDDVELAVFKEYPDSAKTRAVLLQYALALQMETNQPIVNTKTVTEIVTEEGRAHTCVGDVLVPRKSLESSRNEIDVNKIYTYIDFVENRQFNTKERKDIKDIINNIKHKETEKIIEEEESKKMWNYLNDKILFTFKNKPTDIANIKPFVPKAKGQRD